MNIKKLAIVGTTSIVALSLFAVTAFGAADHIKLNSKGQLDPKACNVEGKAVIDVNQKVSNDVDSGIANNWAFDYFTRHIKVWQLDSNHWCATISYDGKFFAVPGQIGPQNDPVDARIDSPVNGDFKGGYRGIITNSSAPSSPDANWPLKGKIADTNYHCNLASDCPGYKDWIEQYFGSSNSFQYGYWGWIYDGGKNGTWVNQCTTDADDIPGNPACTGNSGNIL